MSSIIEFQKASANKLKLFYEAPLKIINNLTNVTPETIKTAAGNSVKELQKHDEINTAKVDASQFPHQAAIGANLANFSYSLKKTQRSKLDIKPLEDNPSAEPLNWNTGEIYANAQNLARELMEMPPNYCTPTYFAERAAKEFEGIENIKLQVFDKDWAQSMKMNTFLSVAQGSTEPCKFLQIEYNGSANKEDKPLALVGITMDTGGISIKGGAGMDLMRGDCGGACTLLATTQAIAKLKLPINVVFVAPLTENMPSGTATKPGDIITSMSGLTVNVLNTDAEGRLVLADALYYVSTKFDPHTVIDCATLTGAMMIALGEAYSGIFSTTDDLWKLLEDAGLAENDKFWRMPFDDFYLKQINNTAADLANTGGRPAGACTAAIFLKQFVDGINFNAEEGEKPRRQYAHIDIAGSMECTKPETQINPYNSTPSKPSTKPRHSTPLKTPLTRFTGSAQTNSPSPLSSSSATPRKKRFVRKQPLKDRILQWPSNFIFKLWVDWDLAHLIDSPKVAKSIGFLLHLLSFLAPILAFTLFVITAINTYTLFTKFRSYRMFMRRDPISSPNARKIQLDLDLDQSREGTPEFERKAGLSDYIVMTTGFLWKYFILLIWRPFLMLIGVSLSKSENSGRMLREGQAEVYQIDMWDINDGSLALFEVYSPAHALCWIFLNASNWMYLIILMIALWCQIHVMVEKYTMLLKDKLIVQGEVMHEYNETFVHPRVFKATKDFVTIKTTTMPELTKDAIEAINSENPAGLLAGQNPVVQVLQVKKATASSDKAPDRYRMVLSDGKYYMQAMLGTQLNSYPEQELLIKNSVIKLLNYAVNVVQNRLLVIALQIDIVETGPLEKIGSPQNFDQTKSQQPQQQTEQQPQQQDIKPDVKPDIKPNFSKGPSSQAPVYPIEGLSPYQNKWTIKARVTQKSDIKFWSNQRGEGKLFSVNLMDETGEIRATGFNESVDEFYNMLEEGKVFFITKARVQIAKKQFSNLQNEYEIAFDKTTHIEPCYDTSDVPDVKYSFTELQNLENLEPNAITDVLGVVTTAEEPSQIISKSTQKPYTKRELNIVDRSQQSVRLTLWGKLAENFDQVNEPVIAFKGVKVSDFGGRSLSMVGASTLFVNPDIPEAHSLRGWYDQQGKNEQFSTFNNSSSTVKPEPGTVKPNEIKTLEQVKQSQLGLNDSGKPDYWTGKATVTYIKKENITYPSCPNDMKKLTQDMNDKWRCEKCESSFDAPEYRYIITCNATDHTGQIWLSGFNDFGLELFKMSANDLQAMVNNGDDASFEAAVKNALGSSFNFNCRAKQDTFNDNVRVM
ncbi:replication factor-a protein [Wallemia mellicola]|uniref:Replication protein A subunit n=1 Tax=Wallemia mellicola TaxID=1708541 RepID=A0AB38MTL5_9BASI|nr:replication factor-a protein [Wallemia mellicola]TIC61760.1 replication factor-a protein [Wallemia mellicola]